MKRLLDILIGIALLLALFGIIGATKELTCLGEKSGTMVVMGGTSTRCR